jgi:hypothetical protein
MSDLMASEIPTFMLVCLAIKREEEENNKLKQHGI